MDIDPGDLTGTRTSAHSPHVGPKGLPSSTLDLGMETRYDNAVGEMGAGCNDLRER